MSEARWALLRVRLETLRDLVGWFAAAVVAVALVDGYAGVQDLRRVQEQGIQIEWYRYIAGAVSGAGIPLIVASIFFSLAVLLTAGCRVTFEFGEAALDDEDEDEEDDAAALDQMS